MPRQGLAKVRARVPASSANVGPGFDVFSVALESPHIEVEFASAPSGTRRIIVEGSHAGEIDNDPSLNAAGKALSALTEEFGEPKGYVLGMKGAIPPGKGLGRSGAEAVGAILCANRKFNLRLSGFQLVQMAGNAEPSHHLDNVSASALGGFNIVTRNAAGGSDVVTTIRPPKDLGVAVLVPTVEKPSTEAARQLVPSLVKMPDHVQAVGHSARIAAAFASGDVHAILDTVPWDGVVEPARAVGGLYGVEFSHLWEEKRTLLRKYHVAETISGAGPSRALWYSIAEDRHEKRKNIVGTIQPAIALVTTRLRAVGYEVQEVFVTKPSPEGARIIPSPAR